MKEFSYEIENKLYEATLGIKRTDIEDDSLGQYRTLAQSEGQEVADFFWREIASLMKNGFSALCYDGQNFFDTDHPVYEKADGTGSNTQTSNVLGSGSGAPWFLLDLSRPLKPFIMQERFKPEFDEIKDTSNQIVFMKDQYLYGIRYRGNWGYGLWQQAVASKEDLTADNFQKAYGMMEALGGRECNLTDRAYCPPTRVLLRQNSMQMNFKVSTPATSFPIWKTRANCKTRIRF